MMAKQDFQQDDYNDSTLASELRDHARRTKDQLLFLKGGEGTQLIMMLHGMGGSGKSTVIALVMAYAQEYCENLQHPFTIQTIVVTALSGVAATLIHGGTTHMAMGLNKTKVTSEMMEAWQDTRLVIIDECSFADSDLFTKIEQYARALKPTERKGYEYFGGLNIVYAGDFSQLEPPGRLPVYDDDCPAFQGVLNAFIELDGKHRYKDDVEYGDINYRLRNGCAEASDIERINSVCCISPTHKPGPNVPVAVYRNRNRDAINCAMYEEFCRKNKPANADAIFMGAVLVFMDELHMQDTAKTFVPVMSNEVKNYFYRNCGEDACKTGEMTSGRVDPVLKLYPGCPMMLTENKDVHNGQANGSRGRLKKVKVRAGEVPMMVHL